MCACGKMVLLKKTVFIKYNTSHNLWLSLIIPLTVCVQEQIKIVKCSMKGGIFQYDIRRLKRVEKERRQVSD